MTTWATVETTARATIPTSSNRPRFKPALFNSDGSGTGVLDVAPDMPTFSAGDLTIGPDGTFFIVWEHETSDGDPDGDGFEIFSSHIMARGFAADGTALGDPFLVSWGGGGENFDPSIVADDSGVFTARLERHLHRRLR